MTIEAQKLIVMSMGKIVASRGKRGGINLHKTLLVSNVLHQARDLFVKEAPITPTNAEVKTSNTTNDLDDLVEKVDQNSSLIENSSLSDESSDLHLLQVVPEIDPRCDEALSFEEDTIYEVDSNDKKTTDCSNLDHDSEFKVRIIDDSISKDDSIKKCANCNKRRFSQPEAEPSDLDCTSPTKRARQRNLSDDSSLLNSSEFSASRGSDPEPMQTECLQITHLVHKFDSGFSGILSPSRDSTIDVPTNSDDKNCLRDNSSSIDPFKSLDSFNDATSVSSCSPSVYNNLVSIPTLAA